MRTFFIIHIFNGRVVSLLENCGKMNILSAVKGNVIIGNRTYLILYEHDLHMNIPRFSLIFYQFFIGKYNNLIITVLILFFFYMSNV